MTAAVCEVLKSQNSSTTETAEGTANHSAKGRQRSPFLNLWFTDQKPISGSLTASQTVPMVRIMPATSTSIFSTLVRKNR